MRYLLSYLALVATVTDAAILHPRGDRGAFTLTTVTPPFADKLGSGEKYAFLKRRQGPYHVNSDEFKCHGSCGALITLNKKQEDRCKETDNQQLSDICFGKCPSAVPQAVYDSAIQVGKDCGFLNQGWKNEEGSDTYPPPQSSLPQQRPTREAPQADEPKGDEAPAAPEVAPSKPADDKPTVSTDTITKPAEITTTADTQAKDGASGAGTPVEVTNSGAKWSVSSPIIVTMAAMVVILLS
ncbi:hypothetical protein CP533_0190 [Ophiocordyceps camponoti-saundersi (nom. inval.)]|nr:hypothetical protein CP533_0190 [Ophiocordyceps camponoti-saundersi (nom. inval.)]